jgi:hypothetical protein
MLGTETKTLTLLLRDSEYRDNSNKSMKWLILIHCFKHFNYINQLSSQNHLTVSVLQMRKLRHKVTELLSNEIIIQKTVRPFNL